MKGKVTRLTLLGTAALAAVPAMAQQSQSSTTPPATVADPGTVADIVVTAQKRSESIQNVPLAITALSGNNLAERNITDVVALVKSVPGMQFAVFNGQPHISIRGVGFNNTSEGQEGRVAYHLDGVYISRPNATIGTFYDIDRVEVLRGPQGTLYGRNATGGSINVITKAPTDHWEGYMQVGYGNYNDLTSEGAVGGPVAPGVRFRVAYTVENRDGYGKNVVTGNDVDDSRRRGARAALSFDLGSSGKLDLSADYYREKDNDYANHFGGAGVPGVIPLGIQFGGFAAPKPRDVASAFDPVNDREYYGFAAHLSFDLGGATLKSITAYRHNNTLNKNYADVTSSPVAGPLLSYERGEQVSQEFQLSGTSGRLKYLAGAYYFREKIFAGLDQPIDKSVFLGGPSQLVQFFRAEGNAHTTAYAGFGQLDYELADRLTITVGGRYNWEKHQISDGEQIDFATPYPPLLPFNPAAAVFIRPYDSRTDKSFTPKAAIEYRPHKDLMFYASVSEGFKSGGFDIGTGAPSFAPEKLWAYEGGIKGTFADGHLRINAAGFYYDYKNLQVTKVVQTNVILLNAASSRVYGAEAEVTMIPFPGFEINASPIYLHATYKDFSTANPASLNPNPIDLSGFTLQQSPRFAVNAGVQYSWFMADGRMKLRGELSYQDRIYFSPFDEIGVSRAPNTKFDAFLNYDRGNWEASLYVKNIGNKTTIANTVVGANFLGYEKLNALEPPRTYGVKVGYHF